MVGRSRKGFTLIELLVVIAIIGILAAMLFPVFARARESARKTQCLANVKNIAIAVQMYLVDWDRFTPLETRREVLQYYIDNGYSTCDSGSICWSNQANPYLRHPVLLDDYTKNRDVWRCPSAKFVKSYAINWGYGRGDWFKYMADQNEAGACYLSPTTETFPSGWGGDITDSAIQGGCSTGGKAFQQQVAVPWTLNNMNPSNMNDAAKQVAVADAGIITGQLDRTSWVAYPDYCRIDQNFCNTTCGGDWDNCPDSQQCSFESIDNGGDGKVSSDVQFRKDHMGSRHLGGSNVGFCDGHAKWFPSETILFGGENWSGFATDPTLFYGIGVCFDPTNAPHP